MIFLRFAALLLAALAIVLSLIDGDWFAAMGWSTGLIYGLALTAYDLEDIR